MYKNESKLQEVKYAPVTHQNEYSNFFDSIKKRDTWFLYLLILSVQLLFIVNGSFLVWTSPALIKLKSNDTELNPIGRPITMMETSFLAGLPFLFGLIGIIAFPKLSDVIGRKHYLVIMSIMMLLSGIALAFSKQIWLIIISHGLFGAFLFAARPVASIYIIEICEDHNKGKFGCLVGLFTQLGYFITYLTGPIFSSQIFTLILVIPTLLFLVSSIFIPESPVYLLSKDFEKECKKSLKTLRNNKSNDELQNDFFKIQNQLMISTKHKQTKLLDLFKVRENRIALLLTLLPLVTQNVCGITIIMAFLAPFFNSAGTNLSGNTVAIIVSILKLFSITLTAFIVERLGRRKILLFSSLGLIIPLFLLGIYFYLKHINCSFIIYLQWLPLTGLLAYIFLYAIGLGCIPMAIICELFTSELRALSSIIIHSTILIISLVLSFAYPIVSATIGIHWCMWMFSLFTAIGSILIYIYFPETKGKSVVEIQKMLREY